MKEKAWLTPADALQRLAGSIKREWKLAFFATVIVAILVHMPVLLADIPNHDGLDSVYFDQNMVTSGRWFLTVACGFSSYYSIPWLIGLLGILFLGVAGAAMVEVLELEKPWAILLTGGLLAAFPALTSTFAYVYTLDGYMMALLLAVMAVLLTKKFKFGFLAGGVCLAFSLGIYQSYLPFAMILSIYAILILLTKEGTVAEKIKKSLHYLYMGGIGVVLYYLLLQLLLALQGKELASYQGIDGMTQGAGAGLLGSIVTMYVDFVKFTFRSDVLNPNVYVGAALLLLLVSALAVLAGLVWKRKWWKNPLFFVIMALLVLALPLVSNVILLISPSVTYHLLMRYQWVLYLIGLVALVERYSGTSKIGALAEWGALLAAVVLIFGYSVSDNIAYSNLEKRYEKTYAYCVRLLDRIEQTEGYYQGIPIAMIGVVGDEQFPLSDITSDVTGGMIGMSGDSLLYTGRNYALFMKHYLGATLNILPPEAMEEMYYAPEYIEMESFPGESAIKIIDGVMYIKTENVER